MAACWTKCSAFAQSQEPRGQRRRPLLSETWHKSIRLGVHALLYINAFLFILNFEMNRKRNCSHYTYRKLCFLHNDIPSSYLPHWGNYDFSSFPVSPGLSAKGMHACSFNYHEIMTPNLEKMQLPGALQLCQLSKHGLLTSPWYFPGYLWISVNLYNIEIDDIKRTI